MQNLLINNTKVINPNFRGINYVHQLYNNMQDMFDRIYTDEMNDIELDAMKKMGINIIRSFYGGSICYDFENGGYNFETELMKAFYKNCKNMEKIGIDVGITPHWTLRGLISEKSTTMSRNTVNISRNGCEV